MRRIGLLRHGETEGGNRYRGSTDDPLTATGVEQMSTAISSNAGWERVVSSPLSRCAEFARAYARQHSLTLSLDARLQEMCFGVWEGRTAAEIMLETPQALTRFWSDPDEYPPPGGESLTCFQARVLEAWNDIVADGHARDILVVTHGGVIRVLLCHALGIPLSRLQEIAVEHGQLHDLRVGSDGLVQPTSKTSQWS